MIEQTIVILAAFVHAFLTPVMIFTHAYDDGLAAKLGLGGLWLAGTATLVRWVEGLPLMVSYAGPEVVLVLIGSALLVGRRAIHLIVGYLRGRNGATVRQ